MRFENSRIYFWGEVAAHAKQPISLEPYKTVSFEGVVEDAALYVGSEDTPRLLHAGRRLRRVPVDRAVACAISTMGAQCEEIAPATAEVRFTADRSSNVRILHAAPEVDEQWRVLTKGTVAIRPREIQTRIARAGAWLAFTLLDAKVGWDAVVIDRSGRDVALSRIEGATLAVPPSAANIDSPRERGITLRPWIGADKRPLSDTHAMLLVFPETANELSSQVPVVTASLDERGLFELATVAPGNYLVALLSSETTGERKKISASAGVPN